MQQKTKRRLIIAAIIFLLLCLIACLTLCDRDDKPEHKRAPSKTVAEVKDEETEKTEPAPEEDVKTDEEQPDHEQPAKEIEDQDQTAKNPAKGGSESNSESADKPGSGQASSTSDSSGSSGGSTTTDKPKEKVWVVDKAAWTEKAPIYKQQSWVLYEDGYKYTTFNSTEAYNKYGEGYDETHGYVINWGTGGMEIAGYETINHPEEGHWEYR